MKNFFFVISALAVLTSCKDIDLQSTTISEDEVDTGVLVPINIGVNGMSMVSTVTESTSTRGHGSIDSYHTPEGRTFNLLMLEKDTVSPVLFDDKPNDIIAYNRQYVFQTEGKTMKGVPADGSILYYPSLGYSDFWAYSLDDAECSDLHPRKDAITVDFRIDGTQDIIVAKADQYKDVLEASKRGIATTTDYRRAYGSFAARNGIQPSLTFEHLLTRLTFSVEACGDSANVATIATLCDSLGVPIVPEATGDLFIDSIKVYVPVTGSLILAYTNDSVLHNGSRILFNNQSASDSAWVSLKQHPDISASVQGEASDFVQITPVTPRYWISEGQCKSLETSVGDALLLPPSSSYDIIVYVRQRVPQNIAVADMKDVRYTYSSRVKIKDGFKKGNTANINFKLFGLRQINVIATITDWVNQEDIEISPDEESTTTYPVLQ